MNSSELPIFWASYEARGSIERFQNGLGIWSRETEAKTERRVAIPHDSVEAALKRLAEKYSGFHVVSELDAVAHMER